MRSIYWYNFLVISFFASSGFSQTTPPGNEGSAPAKPALADILGSAQPFSYYVGAYGSFEFHSKSSASLGEQKTLQGETHLRRSDSGDIELTRQPIYDGPPITYRYVKGRVYIRKKEGSYFTKVRQQKEFDHWLNVAFSEVFTPFKKAGFDDSSQGSIKNRMICWSKSGGNLCIDSATGVPVEGKITYSDKNSAPISLQFQIAPKPPGAITVDSP